jgi:hypothetical protein
VVWAAIALLPATARADDAQDAQRLSDTAFLMLSNLSASSAPGASAAEGAIASFAGDAQSLASALGKGDRDAASQTMAALVGDRRSVDQIVAKHPGVVNDARWAALKTLLASIEHDVPPSHWNAGAPGSAGADVPPPVAESAMLGTAPRVKITSRVFEDGGVRVLGYLQGTDLKTAGIYEGDNLLHGIKVGDTPGEQRIDFNFKLLNVAANDAIRVTDGSGRTAQALVAPQAAIAAPTEADHSKLIEIGPGTGASSASTAMEVASGTANIAEIPSHKRRKRRPSLATPTGPSELTDVQINVLGVVGTSRPNTYQVLGQISGSGVQRAGVYVDGRLAKGIPVTPGQYTSFDVSFTMLGKEAAIRVFDRHNNYVESSIDVTSANGRIYGSNPPIGVNPYAYGVNPYANPYGYGYPTNPYYSPNPYGVNPYGSVNPYAPRPYGSPYGYPNAPNTPWWRRMLP